MKNLYIGFLLIALASGSMLIDIDSGHARSLAQGVANTTADPNQTKPSVPERFRDTLDALAKRWRVTIVAEGQPIITHPELVLLTPDSIASAPEISRDATIRACASYFDYDVLTTKEPVKAPKKQGNVYVLVKRYSDRHDLPDVTLEECAATLECLKKTLAPYNPKMPPRTGNEYSIPHNFIGMLTSKQQATLSAPGGLQVEALNDTQRAAIWRILLNSYVQGLADDVDEVTDFTRRVGRFGATFQREAVLDVFTFGYELPYDGVHPRLYMPISHPKGVRVELDGNSFKSKNIVDGVEREYVDPTAPTPEMEEAVKAPSVAQTLGQLVSGSELMPDGTSRRYTVDKEFAGKRVTVAGKANVPVEQLLDALTALYGLRMVRQSDQSVKLTRQWDSSMKDVSELSNRLQATIPSSFLRAIKAQAPNDPSLPNLPSEFMGPMMYSAYNRTGYKIEAEASSAFRLLMEDKVGTAPDRRIPLSKVGEQERQQFALILFARIMGRVSAFTTRPLPVFLTDFKNIVLTGGIAKDESGREHYSLTFTHHAPLGDGSPNATTSSLEIR